MLRLAIFAVGYWNFVLCEQVMSLSQDCRDRKLPWNQLQEASDPELIRQLKSGNDDALAVIVDRYQRLVLSVALRIVKDEGEAEDVAQTVFVDIFKKVEQFDASRGTLKVWLLQYAYSRGINRRRYLEQRKFYSRLEVGELDLLSPTGGITPCNGWSAGEAARLVRQALGSLTPQQQRAIQLMYFEGFTLDEATGKTGETVSAMRHHYYRGLTKLREFINSSSSTRPVEALRPDAIGLEVANLKPRPI